jgi:hypothetical protein
MNHSNKDTKTSAESGEGRPLIKENAGQSNMYPTQSGKGVSQGLAGVRKAAREHKEMKFTALLHHLTVDLLRESFYSLKRKAAPGVDGVTWQEYETGLEDRLVDLHGRVHRGVYFRHTNASQAFRSLQRFINTRFRRYLNFRHKGRGFGWKKYPNATLYARGMIYIGSGVIEYAR